MLDDQSLHIAVALRLGLQVCKSHVFVCGKLVDEDGHHALVCNKTSGRSRCHRSLNEVVARAKQSAGFQTPFEPPAKPDIESKRPDGQTITPSRSAKRLAWDATCVSSLAVSHIAQTSGTA